MVKKTLDYRKLQNASKVISNSGAYSVEKEQSFNKYLKQLYENKTFDKDLFDKGNEYFNIGGSLENLTEELANNRSFISGYSHAKRLAFIEELEQKGKTR